MEQFNQDRQPLTTAERGVPTPDGSQQAKGELRWIKDKGLYSFQRFHNKWYGSKLNKKIDEFTIGTIVTSRLKADNDLLIMAKPHSAYLKFVAATAQIEFYDGNNVNVMSLGSNLIGAVGGIDLKDNGIVYKYSSTDGASGVHIQLKNCTQANLGAVTGHVSSYDSTIPGFPTTMSGLKGTAKVNSGLKNVAGVSGLVHTQGGSACHAYGGYFKAIHEDAGLGDPYGVRAIAINSGSTCGAVYGGYFSGTGVASDIAYGVYGIATGGTTNWAGYFSGDVKITDDLDLVDDMILGSGSVLTWATDTNLYRFSASILKTDDTFTVGGALNVTGVLYIQNPDTNLYRSNADILKTDDNFISALTIDAVGGFKDNGVAGIDSIGFVIVAGDTITVKGGIITALSH